MKILLTNDDGFDKLGLSILEQSLKRYGNVNVYAPKVEQSAKSHSMTFFEGIKANKINDNLTVVEGSPGDCASLALSLEKDYDLLFSGINDGLNIGIDILYSGTVSAAYEANLHGLKSVAISTFRGNFENVKKIIDKVVDLAFKLLNSIDELCLLNINIPYDIDNIKGVKITRMGHFINQSDVYLENGKYYYKEYNMDYSKEELEFDFNVVNDGYISITPLKIDKTDYKLKEKLENLVKDCHI